MANIAFILSSERSGSTLLQSILNNNSSINSPTELWFLAYDTIQKWYENKPNAIYSLEMFFDKLEIEFNKKIFLNKFYNFSYIGIYNYLDSFLKKDEWIIDKTPGYSNNIKTLNNSLPLNAYYIWLLRHPLGVVNSKIKRVIKHSKKLDFKKYILYKIDENINNFFKISLSQKAKKREKKWLIQNLNILAFLNRIPLEKKYFLFFEELVQQPEYTLYELCTQLNVEFDKKMVNTTFNGLDVPPGMGDINIKDNDSITSDPAFEWEKYYSSQQLNGLTLLFYNNLRHINNAN